MSKILRNLKLLHYVVIFFATISLLYILVWFGITTAISTYFNKQYANIDINLELIDKKEQEYYIRFSKVAPYGFPFKIAWQVIGWQEESKNNIIEFQSPIKIGYDLIKQALFFSYSGQAINQYQQKLEHYDAIKTGFGTIFNTKNYSWTIHIPFSFKLLKVFTLKNNLFEIINFIKEIKLDSNQTQIFDLYDQKKLYEEDYTSFSFSLEKNKYYTDVEDFKTNIPRKLNVNYHTKIIESDIENRKVASGILLYILPWPFAFSFNGNLYITTNKSLFSEITKDWEIKIVSAKAISSTQESDTTLLYQSKSKDDNNIDMYLRINSSIDLKTGFSDQILDSIPYWITYIPALPINQLFLEELHYINNNKEKFALSELENRSYLFALDLNFISRPSKESKLQINDLSLFSKNTGFRITNECKLGAFQDFDIKGLVLLNNYITPTYLIANYVFNLGKFKTLSGESKNIYQEAMSSFLKTISDYPNSKSDILSFEYKLNSNNIKKGKIGTVEIDKILPLYYLALYKKAAEKIRPNDHIKKRIQELVPDFNEHQKLLQQLMIQPFEEIDIDQ